MEHQSCNPIQLLDDGANYLGISLDTYALNRFSIYLRELKEWNRAFNLTAIKSDRDIVIKHFLDSLTAVPFLMTISSLLDIGSGAGFPGIPLKIFLDRLYVVLADSSLKKVNFLQNIIRCLGLRDVSAIHRFIDWHKCINNERLFFDAVVSRGTFSIRDLLMTAKCFLNPGGRVLWMYGSRKNTDAELKNLHSDLFNLFDILSINTFFLPFLNHERTITIFKTKS